MRFLRNFLSFLAFAGTFASFAQTPPATPSAPTAQAPGASPANGKEAAPATEPETPEDKFIKTAADKIDAYQYVDAKIRQVIRVQDRNLSANGIYRKGPGYRCRFELDVDMGDATGKRLVVCDGKVGYLYRKVLEREELEMIKMDQVMGLLDRKELPTQIRRRVLSTLPVVETGDMLRGYLSSVTFTSMKTDEIGKEDKRKVTIVEGHWRRRALEALVGRQAPTDLDSLSANVPQYIRLTIDDKTSWPLKIELFRRDKSAEWKPIFILEFRDLVIGKPLAEAQFAYSPPKEVPANDVTDQWMGMLQALKDKPAAAPTATPKAASAVSAPIAPASKQAPAKK